MKDSHKTTKIVKDGSWGAFHFLAFIGATVYFISQSGGGFWEVILGFLKAIVWPAFAIYHILLLLGA
ncbi:hypothetical protein EOM60_04870 [Candidatus Saccharibacteria bacterium]|nr:hypothetical protein [Candidatus Saccharibacteria bacterium]